MDSSSIKQLMLVKYLFQRGEKALDVHNEMACGVAISHLQDAVEMLLYAAAKEKGVELKKDRCGFADLWRAVNDSVKPKLPLGIEMKDLNNARVNFKHFGNLPAASDAQRFLVSTKRFLTRTTQAIFGQDLESVSLVDLIKDAEVRDMLKQAEGHLTRGEIAECMDTCVRAHDLAAKLLRRVVPRLAQFSSVVVQYGDSQATKDFADMGNYLNVLRDISLAAILDIPAGDFFRYASLDPDMPLVVWGMFRNGHGSGNARPEKTEPNQDDAHFALRYVTDYALAIETHIRVDDGLRDRMG